MEARVRGLLKLVELPELLAAFGGLLRLVLEKSNFVVEVFRGDLGVGHPQLTPITFRDLFARLPRQAS